MTTNYHIKYATFVLITKKKYRKICQLCDRLLLNQSNTVSISYLHILRAHPIFIEKYQCLFLKNKFSLVWLGLIKSSIFSLVRITQGVFYTKSHLKSQPVKRSDILFVSHLINSSHIGNDKDFYFGDLASQLNRNNVSCHIAMLNHCSLRKEKLLKKWKNNHTPRTVLSKNLLFVEEIKIWHQQLKLFFSINPENKAKKQARLHALSTSTAGNMRFRKQISQLVKQTCAKVIITTYEGHAWERLAYDEAKKINPNIKCFGYQHTAIFKYQHAVKRPLQGTYNPDVILSSSQIDKAMLDRSEAANNSTVVCIGSPRYIKPVQITKQEKHCLVIPEGLLSECLLLFELSLDYVQRCPSQQFIWRLHPLIDFQVLAKKSQLFKDIPNNITLSEQSLEDDVKQCNSVLYRGSTAVVGAINSGLKPIYYQQKQDELSIDPIYQQELGKFIVANQAELKMALEQDIDDEAKQKLQEFAQNFYTPLDVEALVDLL